MNAVSVEMLQRDSVFQRTLDERKRVAEDVLLKVFTATYWIIKKELPNDKIKSHVQPPELTCILGFLVWWTWDFVCFFFALP